MKRGEGKLYPIRKILDSTATDLARIVQIRRVLAETRKDKLPKSLKKLRGI